MADGGLEYHPQGHNLVVQRASGRRFVPRLVLAFRFQVGLVEGGHPVNPVFLHLPGSDLVDGEVAKKRHQVDTQANGVTLGPLFAVARQSG